ncbi:MAG: ribosome biogenesis GTPase Der [Bacilli bacterium]|jgi:GTP-binding protein|nr:ribosome biogenesis GTPase Der [Bacilli bacterium]
MKQTVCLIGRPNVGKSSLFNRLIKEDRAIIMDVPGITRDRIYGTVQYQNKSFFLIDTGGLDLGHQDFKEDIFVQASFAMEEADTILFIVDGTQELNENDYRIRDLLMKSQKRVIVVVNKIDNLKREDQIYAFYELGFETVLGVSAAHKRGLTELLEEITQNYQEQAEEEEEICKFCLIGRPNVGKSSLMNALLNEERAIVSEVAGTTRDAVDTRFTYHNEDYIVIDTAGIRKKGRIYEEVERYSLLRSMKAMERSDVCVLVIDAEDGIKEHEKHIVSMAIELGKGIVIVVNKWDLVKNPDQEIKNWKEKLFYEFQFLRYAKIVFLSAFTKKRIHTLMPEIIAAYENNRKYIMTSQLNNVIEEAVKLHEAPSYKGKRLKIYYVAQMDAKPPKFVFHVNNKGLVHFSYERYLENKIRENFDLTGTPILLKFKNKSEK